MRAFNNEQQVLTNATLNELIEYVAAHAGDEYDMLREDARLREQARQLAPAAEVDERAEVVQHEDGTATVYATIKVQCPTK